MTIVLFMKKLLLLFFLTSLFRIASAQSQLKQTNQALQEINRRGEVYFSFQLDDLTKLSEFSRAISISSIKGNTVYAYANRKEFSSFSNKNKDFTVLTAPSELYPVPMSSDLKQVLTWNYYPTYDAYIVLMQQFATLHPAICKLITITTLASGRKIQALRITDNVNTEENEPEFLYTSSIHGDELTGAILMLHLVDYLLSSYGTDTRITNMVNNFDIVICPLANPDGTYAGGNSTVNGATRYNANNIDLNRNYPDPQAGQHPDGNVWQPETVAFMNFAAQNTFTMGVNFHGGAEVVNYPWDTWSKLSADDAWWKFVCKEYADTVHHNSPVGYMTLYPSGITNGYAWYQVTGGRQDYMNYFHHCRESTIELSDYYILPVSLLVPYWNYNCRSFLNYIEQAGYGLHGIVTDSLSGDPLPAKVFISGFDKDSSNVNTDPQVGDYHRLLKGGSYNVTYSATGYLSKTIPVQVIDRQTTVRNVKLLKGTLSTSIITTNHAGSKIYPNPVTEGNTIIEAQNPVQKLVVKDMNGRIVYSSTPQTNKLTIDCNWPSGVYLFQLTIMGKIENEKIQVINH